MSIGELAERTGVSTRTIRYYEELAILPQPDRTGGGTRRYSHEYVFYIRGALAMKELGFTLDQIIVLSKWAMGRVRSRQTIRDAEQLVEEKMSQLDGRIQLLTRVRRLFEARREVPALPPVDHTGEPDYEWLSIGALAERTGVSTRTIRYYEQLGILPQTTRTDGGTRRYPAEYEFYVKGALAMKELGFTLEQIKLLSDWVQGHVDAPDGDRAAEELVAGKMNELDGKIRLLRKIKRVLNTRRAASVNGAGGQRGDDRRVLSEIAEDVLSTRAG